MKIVVQDKTANTTLLKNGPFAGPLRGQSAAQTVNVNGGDYNGDVFTGIGLNDSSHLVALFYGLPIVSGQVDDLARVRNQISQWIRIVRTS